MWRENTEPEWNEITLRDGLTLRRGWDDKNFVMIVVGEIFSTIMCYVQNTVVRVSGRIASGRWRKKRVGHLEWVNADAPPFYDV